MKLQKTSQTSSGRSWEQTFTRSLSEAQTKNTSLKNAFLWMLMGCVYLAASISSARETGRLGSWTGSLLRFTPQLPANLTGKLSSTVMPTWSAYRNLSKWRAWRCVQYFETGQDPKLKSHFDGQVYMGTLITLKPLLSWSRFVFGLPWRRKTTFIHEYRFTEMQPELVTGVNSFHYALMQKGGRSQRPTQSTLIKAEGPLAYSMRETTLIYFLLEDWRKDNLEKLLSELESPHVAKETIAASVNFATSIEMSLLESSSMGMTMTKVINAIADVERVFAEEARHILARGSLPWFRGQQSGSPDGGGS